MGHIVKLWKYLNAIFSLGGTFSISKSQKKEFSPDLTLPELFEEMEICPPKEVHLETLACRDSSYFTFSEMLRYFRRIKTLGRTSGKMNLLVSGTDQLASIANMAELFQTRTVIVGAMDPFGSDRLVNFWLAMQAAEEMYRTKKTGALMAQGGCIAEPPFLTKEDPQALFGAFGSRLSHAAFSLQANGELVRHRKPWMMNWSHLYQPDLDEMCDNTGAYAHLTLGKILTITARIDVYQAENLLAMVEKTLHTPGQILGILIRGFGTGGIQTRMPLRTPDGIVRNHTNTTMLWRTLRGLSEKIPIVMTTQCARGGVTEDYEYAAMLKEAGILLSGFSTEDFLDVYMTTLAVASLTQTSEEKERGPWIKKQLGQFFQNNTMAA